MGGNFSRTLGVVLGAPFPGGFCYGLHLSIGPQKRERRDRRVRQKWVSHCTAGDLLLHAPHQPDD